MKRREFISLLGGAAAWPLAARGQQPALPVVGFLHSSVPIAGATHLTTAFRQGLKEAGFVEGQNVTIEFRSAEGQPDRLRALVAELIRLPVAVLAGNTLAMLAAKEATITVPIVFAGGTDPVKVRLVDSLSRPGGNVTGASFFGGVLGAKRLELFRQLVPKATTIAMLVRPNTIETEAERRDVQAAAQALGQHLVILDATSARDIDAAFATFVQRGDGALLVGAGPFMVAHRKQVIALAARYALPASYALREFVEAGGLMSYGDSRRNLYICPAGATLTTSGRVHSDHAIRYFASVPRCRECPLKQRCCPNMPSRRIVRDVNEAARDIARRKMQTKAFLKSRDQKKRVEMRFAHLKTHHGFERMRLRGLSGARDEFHLAAIVQNLKTMAMRLLGPPPKLA